MRDAADKKLAKRLARLVVEAGEDGVRQLRPALEKILAGRSTADTKAFLKTFHKAVVREIARDTLTIESATELSDEVVEGLVKDFEKEHDRPIIVARKTTPELIAGIRVRLGDTVYDASLAGNLDSLASQIH